MASQLTRREAFPRLLLSGLERRQARGSTGTSGHLDYSTGIGIYRAFGVTAERVGLGAWYELLLFAYWFAPVVLESTITLISLRTNI